MSSSLTTYDLTVPIFVRNLEQLVACLKKGEEWAKENNKDPQVLVDASIIDDMKPLTFQIQSCCNTSKAVLPRIGGEEAVSVEDNETTLSQLLVRLESTIKILRSAKKDKFLAPDAKCIVKLGPREAEFDVLGYIQKFALPNFFFHMTTAYDILRKEGVPVGKLDFLGGSDLTTWTM
ncbi:hypothetical protein SMMN14_09124 [Sphaerulina musiva]